MVSVMSVYNFARFVALLISKAGSYSERAINWNPKLTMVTGQALFCSDKIYQILLGFEPNDPTNRKRAHYRFTLALCYLIFIMHSN